MTVDIASLVSENLHIWTTAVERKSGAGRGGGKKFSLLGIDRLRALILDLAVRGKLVPQDSNEEPAPALLKRIAKEKAQRVFAGEIRKPRELDNGDDLRPPFSIPETWQWVRLDEVGAIIGGGTPPAGNSSNFVEGGQGVPWLTPADLGGYKERFISHGERDLTEAALKTSSATVMPAGSVLFTSRAPIGYVVIAANPISTNQGFKSIVPYIAECSLFIATAMKSFAKTINDNAPGTTFKEVSGKMVAALPFPLPPLAEQQRIVAKLDELMALCDTLETESAAAIVAHQTLVEALLATLTTSADADDLAANWTRLETHFDTLFTTGASVDALKQGIIDIAVHGKLVPQSRNDEGAGALLKSIQNERAKIIGTKKASKVPTTARNAVTLPDGWEWAPLACLGFTMTGGTPKSAEPENFEGSVPFIGPGQISLMGKILAAEKFISETGVTQSTEALPGDVLMVCIGGSIGKSAIARERMAFNQQINSLRPVLVECRYIEMYFKCSKFQAEVLDLATGSATPIINRSRWESIPVALPPLAEQQRILSKVDDILAMCDELLAYLADAALTQKHLGETIVELAAA